MSVVVLSAGQAELLQEAADNGGVLYLGGWATPAEVKAAKALVRQGMLSVGDPRGHGHHHVTGHGERWLAAHGREPA